MTKPSHRYRVTFVCEVSFTSEVLATDPPDAHFTAFCDTASVLQNDPVIKDRLTDAAIRVNLVHPKYLRHVQRLDATASSPTNESHH